MGTSQTATDIASVPLLETCGGVQRSTDLTTANGPGPSAVAESQIAKSQSDERIGAIVLSLSGGGFRATLFHLGMIRFLLDVKLFPRTEVITAVSGGSILAAHIAKHWEQYTQSETFDAAVRPLLGFLSSDVRGRVCRRWIWGLVSLSRIVRRGWSRIGLLEREYQTLLKGATLGEVAKPNDEYKPLGEVAKPGEEHKSPPAIHLLATSMITGRIYSFAPPNIRFTIRKVDEFGVENFENQVRPCEGFPLARAVAASSAFPPLFPPLLISYRDVNCTVEEFPTVRLTDGGIFDNLGVDYARTLHGGLGQFATMIVSDAGALFDLDARTKFRWLTSRAARSIDILMKRIGDLEYGSAQDCLEPNGRRFIFVRLQDQVRGSPLPQSLQRELRRVRTDLNPFTPYEMKCLMLHGYEAARAAIEAKFPSVARVGSGQGKLSIAKVLCLPADEGDLHKSDRRPWLLVARSDWRLTVLTAVALLIWSCVLAWPFYRQHRKNNAQVAELKQRVVETQRSVLRSRRSLVQPIQGGISLGPKDLQEHGTICCVVKDDEGRPYILFHEMILASCSDPTPVLVQPGLADAKKWGGQVASIAKFTRSIPINSNVDNDVTGAIALLDKGVGSLPGLRDWVEIDRNTATVQAGALVTVIGRKVAVADGRVISTNYDCDEEWPGKGRIHFINMIQVQLDDDARVSNSFDSGAAVIDAKNHLVGMVIGGGQRNYVVVPIDRVLKALKVHLAN
jgi:predicted acylesterase/phospholipase RssA